MGADSSIGKVEATMDYIFLTLQFIPLQCIKEVPYIALQKGNVESNLSDLKAYGGTRVRIFGLI